MNDTATDLSVAAAAGGTGRSEQQLQLALQAEVRRLAARDREVRAHEQAHASVGGRYAGAPRYELERGPNGVSYAVAGAVSIDVAPVPNDPAATLRKMLIVQRAALAPAQPSSADRAIAARAAAQAAEARAELAQQGGQTERADTQAEDGAIADTAVRLIVDSRGAAVDVAV